MSNNKKPQLNTKVKALKYFHNSETRVNILPLQVFKATNKYAKGLIDAGLAEEANQNAKVGLGTTKEGVAAIKEAKEKADARKAKVQKELKDKDEKRQAKQKAVVAANLKLINKGKVKEEPKEDDQK